MLTHNAIHVLRQAYVFTLTRFDIFFKLNVRIFDERKTPNKQEITFIMSIPNKKKEEKKKES